jgi:hypothetical protein
MTCRLLRLGLSLPNLSEKNADAAHIATARVRFQTLLSRFGDGTMTSVLGFGLRCEPLNPLRLSCYFMYSHL